MSVQESLFIPWTLSGGSGPRARMGAASNISPTNNVATNARLHVRRIAPESQALGPPVLMLHGAIENSRIFYTESGKGLGPFLARYGFDVYAADLLGRGQSEPLLSRESRHGQFESITQEIPAFIDLIRSRRGDEPQIWVGHSWGGVLMLSVLIRYPELRKYVRGAVFFGTKRSVYSRSLERVFKIDFFWNRAARALIKLHGYLPAKIYGFGSDDESDLSHDESRRWVKPGPWVDPRDGFDYGSKVRGLELPPLLFLAGQGDHCLGNPQDVRALIRELGAQEIEFQLLGQALGNAHDYGHIDMLTHPKGPEDHFPQVLKWIRSFSKK